MCSLFEHLELHTVMALFLPNSSTNLCAVKEYSAVVQAVSSTWNCLVDGAHMTWGPPAPLYTNLVVCLLKAILRALGVQIMHKHTCDMDV